MQMTQTSKQKAPIMGLMKNAHRHDTMAKPPPTTGPRTVPNPQNTPLNFFVQRMQISLAQMYLHQGKIARPFLFSRVKDHQRQSTQIHTIPADTCEHSSNNHGTHVWRAPAEGRCRLEKNGGDDEQPLPVESGIKLAKRESKDNRTNCESIFFSKKGI